MKRQRIDTYDAWRGIAALMILFSHMSYLSAAVNPFWKGFYAHFMRYGGSASSFFFLCSGFFLCYTWKSQSFGVYIKGKLKRVYPLALLVFLLALAVDLLLSGNETVSKGVVTGSPQWFFNIAANLFLFKAFIPVESTFYSFHGPSWFLSVLFWLYVAAHPFLKRLSEGDGSKTRKVIMAICLIAYVLELALCIITRVLHWASLYPCYVNPWFRIFGEGFAGILLCEYQEPIRNRLDALLKKLRMSYTALELIAVVLFFLDFALHFYIKLNLYTAWLQIIPMGLILIAFRSQQGAVSRVLLKKPFLFLGAISFELYMTHAFVYEGLPIAVGIVSSSLNSWLIAHAGTRFGITVVLCIAFAWIVHQLMELFYRKVLTGK